MKAGQWKPDREPFALETSAPGIFAVGDIRSGSVKRVAASVGEGGIAIAVVHHTFSSPASRGRSACASGSATSPRFSAIYKAAAMGIRRSCRESNLTVYQGFCHLSCRFIPTRSDSFPLVTCGFVLEP
jgi:hypothetical protein